jgi:hypothetical protein
MKLITTSILLFTILTSCAKSPDINLAPAALLNTHTNTCLTSESDSRVVTAVPCTNTINQQWRTNDGYIIINNQNQRCLEADWDNNIYTSTCTDSSYQKWGAGFKNLATGKCITSSSKTEICNGDNWSWK